MKLYTRLVDFELRFRNTLSNGKMVYISNVDLDVLDKICIHDFSCWDRLGCRKVACTFENFKIEDLTSSNSVK